MRVDRFLALVGGALLAAGAVAWSAGPVSASFLPPGNVDGRIVWASTRPQPAPINQSNGELGLWTVDPSTITCTSGGSPCTAWSQGDISELTGFDAQHCENGNNDDQPFSSPQGDKVIYRSDCTGNHEIWKVDANPVGLHTGVQLTTDGGENSRPSWAPDGHHFVYQHLNGHEQLWSADDSGPIVPALVYGDPNADALTPVYDPGDQTKIVFVSSAGGHDEIVLLDTTANTLTNLSRLSIGQTGCTTPVGSPFGASCSTPTAFNDDKPDVASDGGRIVFQSTRPLTVGGAVQTKPQIWSFVYNHGGAGLGTNPMTLFGGTGGDERYRLRRHEPGVLAAERQRRLPTHHRRGRHRELLDGREQREPRQRRADQQLVHHGRRTE